MSDETYLEGFVESIATLPHNVRRNLELLRDMDASCAELVQQWTQAQQAYVQAAHDKMMQLEVTSKGVKVLSGNGQVVIPTTEELYGYLHNESAYREIQTLQTNAMQQADEKVAIAEQTYNIIDSAVKRLDQDLSTMEKMLKATGEFEVTSGGKPDDLAAIQVNPSVQEWILAKVISHDAASGMYTLSDEDSESNKIFHLPESQVVVLDQVSEKLCRGDVVYAVYPDTTSFYQATVVQTLRKTSGGGGGGGGTFCLVNFVDDSDEHGITHDKAVLLQHIMRPPYGAAI